MRNKGGTIRTPIYAEAPVGSIHDGIADIAAGLKRWPIWWTLTWKSTRSQYRRTYLGPWWITVQQVIFVAGLSLLFGLLFQQDLRTFVPYVAIGFITFTWMTGMLQGGSSCIVDNGAALKTTPGPLSIYALKNFASNTVQFAHDIIVIIAVLIIFQVSITWTILLAPIGIVIIAINGVAIGLWLGPVCARYRDVGQLITSLTRILFFFTPVFWLTTDLTRTQLAAIAGWNPLAYFLQFVRGPLLGDALLPSIVIGTVAFTTANCLIALVHFSRTRDRLAYWL